MMEQSPRRTVLVVDDNACAGYALCELLQALGYVAEAAKDGPEALAKALAVPPDIVLSDIELPGFDGYELARRLRAALGPSVVLIAATGYKYDHVRRQAAEAGFDHFFTKPLDPETFKACVAVGKPSTGRAP